MATKHLTILSSNDMATIRDVAEASGVSIATVSYILNNRGRSYSAETSRRVKEIAHRLNYHPSAAARRLVQKRIHTLGVLFGWREPSIMVNMYASLVLAGIYWEAERRQNDVHIFTTPWIDADTSARQYQDHRTDGVIIVAPNIDSDMASGLNALNIPCVVISSPSNVAGVPYVDVDNAKGATLAVQHLIDLGHKRIAFFTGHMCIDSSPMRYAAFQKALSQAGIPIREDYVFSGSFDAEFVREHARQLLSLPELPTAVFCTNDEIAIILMDMAKDAGIRVPEDLSVVGFDDFALSKRMTPPLTTVASPLSLIGERAAQILLDRIDSKEITDMVTIFSPELVVRETTAPPRPIS